MLQGDLGPEPRASGATELWSNPVGTDGEAMATEVGLEAEPTASLLRVSLSPEH